MPTMRAPVTRLPPPLRLTLDLVAGPMCEEGEVVEVGLVRDMDTVGDVGACVWRIMSLVLSWGRAAGMLQCRRFGGCGWVGGCFHFLILALMPKRYSWRVDSSSFSLVPSRSSNASTREEMEPRLYSESGRIQLGFCVTVRAAYTGFSAKSASWHSSDVRGFWSSVVCPVGTPFMEIFDHLTFGLVVKSGMSVCRRMPRSMMEFCFMKGAALSSWCCEIPMPAVSIRFPFPVHLAADMWTVG